MQFSVRPLFRVTDATDASKSERTALEHFDRRELINGIYQRQLVRVATDLGEMAAYAYIARPDHEQYCSALPETEAAQLIATATGSRPRGTSLDYLEQCMTALHRQEPQDIREPALGSMSWI